MTTATHLLHLASRVSYNDCGECRADCERQFLRQRFEYQHVGEYLAYIRPRLKAIKNRTSEGISTSAQQWHREFVKALNRRISLKTGTETGRKQCDSYLERLKQFPRNTDADYLRQFAQKGASAL